MKLIVSGEQRDPDGRRGRDIRPVPALGNRHQHAVRRRLSALLFVRNFIKLKTIANGRYRCVQSQNHLKQLKESRSM